MGILKSVVESLILDPVIRQLTLEMLDKAPKKFWVDPSSVSGFYHAVDERGPGGLELHSARVACMGLHAADMVGLPPKAVDLVLAACVVHDIVKYGDDSVPTLGADGKAAFKRHGSAVIDWMRQNFGGNQLAMAIAKIACTHNGRWSEQGYRPRTKLQKIVHMADFFASRTNVSVDISKAKRRG